MKIYVKMFPIAGICEAAREMELELGEGNLDELLIFVREHAGVTDLPLETLMFLLNGRGIDIQENVQFRDGDHLWLLPKIYGG